MNNSIKSFNNAIKSKYTEWERFKLSEFMDTIQEIISDYSEATMKVPFPTVINISETIWIKLNI